jgi:small subunit ribosomal protein S21
MVQVIRERGESDEQLLKRFRKDVTRSGILGVVRRKRWHIGKSELRRIEKKKSLRRLRRRLAKQSQMGR